MLKEGGRVIPESVELSIVPVEAPAKFRRVDFWKTDLYGLDFSPVRPFAFNNYYNFNCAPDNFLSDPKPLGSILIAETENTYVRGTASCVATRTGVLHGIAGWMCVNLAGGITIANCPSMQDVHWSQTLFPVETPLAVAAGDCISVALSSHDGSQWRWQVQVTPQAEGGNERQAKEVRFDHSSFFGFPVTPHDRTGTIKPKLSRRGEAEQFLLGLLNGENMFTEMEKEIAARYRDIFPSPASRSAFMKEVIKRNSI